MPNNESLYEESGGELMEEDSMEEPSRGADEEPGNEEDVREKVSLKKLSARKPKRPIRKALRSTRTSADMTDYYLCLVAHMLVLLFVTFKQLLGGMDIPKCAYGRAFGLARMRQANLGPKCRGQRLAFRSLNHPRRRCLRGENDGRLAKSSSSQARQMPPGAGA